MFIPDMHGVPMGQQLAMCAVLALVMIVVFLVARRTDLKKKK